MDMIYEMDTHTNTHSKRIGKRIICERRRRRKKNDRYELGAKIEIKTHSFYLNDGDGCTDGWRANDGYELRRDTKIDRCVCFIREKNAIQIIQPTERLFNVLCERMDINLQVDKMHVLIECSRMTSKTIQTKRSRYFSSHTRKIYWTRNNKRDKSMRKTLIEKWRETERKNQKKSNMRNWVQGKKRQQRFIEQFNEWKRKLMIAFKAIFIPRFIQNQVIFEKLMELDKINASQQQLQKLTTTAATQ